MPARAFLRVDHLKLDPHAARHGRKVAVALHLRFGVGQPDPTVAMVIPNGVLWIVPQLFIKCDGM